MKRIHYIIVFIFLLFFLNSCCSICESGAKEDPDPIYSNTPSLTISLDDKLDEQQLQTIFITPKDLSKDFKGAFVISSLIKSKTIKDNTYSDVVFSNFNILRVAHQKYKIVDIEDLTAKRTSFLRESNIPISHIVGITIDKTFDTEDQIEFNSNIKQNTIKFDEMKIGDWIEFQVFIKDPDIFPIRTQICQDRIK
ncbi:MAG: hypothetical protein ACSHW7_09480 [Patiriisocius sp.]|uniref:hypothetical protein n=1 Tax=Patiriisocius sp. TaxID=2822396 RepID=UPI003EF6DCCD